MSGATGRYLAAVEALERAVLQQKGEVVIKQVVRLEGESDDAFDRRCERVGAEAEANAHRGSLVIVLGKYGRAEECRRDARLSNAGEPSVTATVSAEWRNQSSAGGLKHQKGT